MNDRARPSWAMTANEVERCLREHPEATFHGGASDQEVDAAESAFDGRFPTDFVHFLKTFGSGEVSSEELLGLGGQPHRQIVRIAEHLRSPSREVKLPRTFVPIRGDGFGNYECIDLSTSSQDRSRVVSWSHAADDRPSAVDERGYWEWLSDLFRMIADLDDGA